MSEFTSHQELLLEVPDSLGSGRIVESDYLPTDGVNLLLGKLLGYQPTVKTGTAEFGSVVCDIAREQSDVLSAIIDPEVGPEILRTLHATADLISDQYDIAETLRLVSPIKQLVDAKISLGIEINEAETDFVVRTASLDSLLDAISSELERSYRRSDQSTTESPMAIPESSYTIENKIVDAVNLGQRESVHKALAPELDKAVFVSSGNGPSYDAAKARVDDFIKGLSRSVEFIDISLVDTIDGATAIEKIATSSEIGRLSAWAAGVRTKYFAWSGKQVQLDQEWVSVVLGGSVSQS